MPKCPHCHTEVHLNDFFDQSSGVFGFSSFKGEQLHIGFKNYAKMYVCPHCDCILGFSEYKWDDE